jgi:hypothetical protein
MTQDNPDKRMEFHTHEESSDDDIFDAECVKIGFCPDCGTTVIVLGDYDRDVAVAHLPLKVLDGMINDLQSIRLRLNN